MPPRRPAARCAGHDRRVEQGRTTGVILPPPRVGSSEVIDEAFAANRTQNVDTIVVTPEVAAQHDLKSVDDLANVGPEGRLEDPTRVFGSQFVAPVGADVPGAQRGVAGPAYRRTLAGVSDVERMTFSFRRSAAARVRERGAKAKGGASGYLERLVREDELREALRAHGRWFAAHPDYAGDAHDEATAAGDAPR